MYQSNSIIGFQHKYNFMGSFENYLLLLKSSSTRVKKRPNRVNMGQEGSIIAIYYQQG